MAALLLLTGLISRVADRTVCGCSLQFKSQHTICQRRFERQAHRMARLLTWPTPISTRAFTARWPAARDARHVRAHTMVWKTNQDTPQMLMFQRHSGYSADEVANPDIINFLTQNTNPVTGQSALANSGNQFNSAYRRSFQQLCYGGYNIIHDVSQSVAQRIRVDQNIEVCQLYELGHPDAYQYDTANPKYSPCALKITMPNSTLARPRTWGPSRGSLYDMYCPGFCTLERRPADFPGGHDMNSQNVTIVSRFTILTLRLGWHAPYPACDCSITRTPTIRIRKNTFQNQITLGKNRARYLFPTGNSTNGDCNPHRARVCSRASILPQITSRFPFDGSYSEPFRA